MGRIRIDGERGHRHPRGGCPPGSIGKGFPGVAIYDPDTVTECAAAEFDEHGALVNGDDAIGELVNTQGAGMFAGYYNDQDATEDRMRHGMFWSGDLAYRDADGWIYLAGRTADWMRVDGENMTSAPIERILIREPAISMVAVYPVPDEFVGDQVMAAIVLQDDATLTPNSSARSSPSSPICPRKPGPDTSGSPTTCRAPRPTRCSSVNWSRWAPRPTAGRCGSVTAGSTSFRPSR